MNIRRMVDELIAKVKKMEVFNIVTPLPDNFEFGGKVPFDIKIANGLLTCQVHAVSVTDAQAQVNRWLEERTQGEC